MKTVEAYRVKRVWKDGTVGYPDSGFYTDYEYVKKQLELEQKRVEQLGYSGQVQVKIESACINT